MINEFSRQALVVFLLCAGVIAAVHPVVIDLFLPPVYGEVPWWLIYLFLVPLSLATIAVVALRYKKDRTSAANTFFIFVFVKMFGSVIFLLPWILHKTPQSVPFLFLFMIIFFLMLFVETLLIVRFLNRPISEKSKND